MKVQKNPLVLKPLVIATLMTLGAGNASAIEFEVGDGWKGNWNTTLSYGAAWRATGQNTGLFTQADGARVGKSGGTGGNQSDSGNLNWNSGDITTSVFKFVTDVSIEKNGWGGLLRVKGWTDSELQNGQQRFRQPGPAPLLQRYHPGWRAERQRPRDDEPLHRRQDHGRLCLWHLRSRRAPDAGQDR
ncbi:MAG: DUF1302 family protein [Dechloromonas sp.]|uniref:DUF1302 family protein n=1 Tax=Candidatus Dechloromonas phosphorivorans TaxID=2899244 RepID=A0A9D7QKT6_9RHOO|nr:DUF1302 family protein [Candidatus Dechloromonas phosphorivorans]